MSSARSPSVRPAVSIGGKNLTVAERPVRIRQSPYGQASAKPVKIESRGRTAEGCWVKDTWAHEERRKRGGGGCEEIEGVQNEEA